MRKRRKRSTLSITANSQETTLEASKPGLGRIKILFLPILLLAAVIAFGAIASSRSSRSGMTPAHSSQALVMTTSTPSYAAASPAKEYIYSSGKLVAETEPNRPIPNDLAVWRLSTGTWWVLNSDGTNLAQQFGQSTDLPAPGDYDGDGKTDFCVYRPSEGNWYVLKTTTNAMAVYTFGNTGDKPEPADYDGDGITDLALYRPGNLTWYIHNLGSETTVTQPYGNAGDTPLPSDYDGDGKADIAMWRHSNGTWYILQSGLGTERVETWGQDGDKAVPGDYDGDGKTDLAIWRNDNIWYIKRSSDGQWMYPTFGTQSSDTTVQGDYDGDGKTDVAIWRVDGTQGYWYILKSSTSTVRTEAFGSLGDTPVPAPYRRTN